MCVFQISLSFVLSIFMNQMLIIICRMRLMSVCTQKSCQGFTFDIYSSNEWLMNTFINKNIDKLILSKLISEKLWTIRITLKWANS